MACAGDRMSYDEIAACAYEAYGQTTGNKNFRGEPMPAFKDLPEAIKRAWRAAMIQAENCFTKDEPMNSGLFSAWYQESAS